jgi:hypothetical protein
MENYFKIVFKCLKHNLLNYVKDNLLALELEGRLKAVFFKVLKY